MQKIIENLNLKDWKEIVGWLGTFLVLIGYVLISLGILSSENVLYFVINTIGSLGLSMISFVKKTYQPAILNLIFVFVGIIGIIRILF